MGFVESVVIVEPDSKYPNMFRFRVPGGELSDMLNISRAKDAALLVGMRHFWKSRESTTPPARIRLNRREAPKAPQNLNPYLLWAPMPPLLAYTDFRKETVRLAPTGSVASVCVSLARVRACARVTLLSDDFP